MLIGFWVVTFSKKKNITNVKKMSSSSLIESLCIPNTTQGCGNGICLPDGSSCVCSAGYIHDFMWMRFANCYLTEPARAALLLFPFSCAVASIAWSLYNLRGSTKMPRLMCYGALGLGISEAGMMLGIYLEQKIGNVSMFFFALLIICSTCYSIPLFIWVFVSPIVAMTKKPMIKERMKRMWMGMVIGVVSLSMMSWILMFIYQDNVRAWNLIMASYFIELSFIGCVYFFLSRHWSNRLLQELTVLQANVSTDLEEYKQVLIRISRVIFFVATSALSLIIIAAVYLSIGPWPYAHIVSIVSYNTANVMSVYAVIFAQRQHRRSKATATSVMGSSTNQVTV